MKYQILQKDKTKYICLVLLNEIIQFQTYFPTNLTGEDVFLDHYLKILNEKGLVTIKDGEYIPTDKGRAELETFYAKYYEYLKMFDIYCAVDLEKGEFAFSHINDDWKNDDEWFNFLAEERFSDVRVAVAEFKGLNPTEIVFMSFLNENVFDCTVDGWQNRLTSDDIWKEIEEICNTAVSKEYLETDGVLEDVIKQGTVIAMQLIKDAEDSLNNEEETTTVTETTEVEEYVDVVEMPVYGYSYWEPYYDPFYISPIWIGAAIILW